MVDEPDWSGIHADIGYAIFTKLSKFMDRIWFGAVCRNWYHIAKDYDPLARRSQVILPMLLIPVEESESQRAFYTLSKNKLNPKIRLRDIPNQRCCGSSHGWLAFVEEDLSVTLINPFKFEGDTIHLPILDTRGIEPNDLTVCKLIVSPDSTPNNYTVVTIYDHMLHLAFIRSTDKDWTYSKNYFPKGMVAFNDIVFHNGLIYATDCNFRILSVDLNSSPLQIKILKKRAPFILHERWRANYIVKSTAGDLYAIRRRTELDDFITKVFKVMKLEIDQESGKLISCNEVNTIDGDAFFIGESDCVSVKASDYNGCKPNSIYFIDDYWVQDGRDENNEIEDSGIYNVEDKSIVRHYVRHPNQRCRPPAIWVQPPYH